MFVDQTVGGGLTKRLKEIEDRMTDITGFRVKISEMGGTQLSQLLPNTNPWAGSKCSRETCHTCNQGDERLQDCFRRNILYESTCTVCEKREREKSGGGQGQHEKGNEGVGGQGKLAGSAVYVGESSRSIFERSQEHIRDAKKKTEDSHIWKHWSEEHPGQEMPHFRFQIVRLFRDCLSRQIAEAVRIEMREGAVLNSKAVFSRCKLPRLVVERLEWEQGSGGMEREVDEEEERTEEEKTEDMEILKREGECKRKGEKEKQEPRPGKRFRRERKKEDWGEQLEEEQEGIMA